MLCGPRRCSPSAPLFSLPRSPRYGTATEYGSDFRFEVEPMCDHLFGDDLARSYAHLDAESASRHVVVALGWTPILSFCAIHPSGRYGSKRPVSQRLLRRMRWLMLVRRPLHLVRRLLYRLHVRMRRRRICAVF